MTNDERYDLTTDVLIALSPEAKKRCIVIVLDDGYWEADVDGKLYSGREP